MSLVNPSLLDKLKPYRIWIIGVALLLVILSVGFIFDRCGEWRANRADQKTKDKIGNLAANIANISNAITNLELEKAKQEGELTVVSKQFETDLVNREDAKKETNQAIANFQKAVNANSNIDRTAEDLKEVLRKLEQ